jgi:outer membrane protein TolC
VATIPSLELSDRISKATGVADAIELRSEGEPLDAVEPAADMLALPEAVRRALLHSPQIQKALAQVRAAEAEAGQARLLPNPIMNVLVRLPENVEVNLALDLISLLTRPGRISAADSRLRAAAAGALSEVLDVLSTVQGQYLAVQTIEELLAVLGDRLRINSRLLEIASSRLQAGEGTRLDVLSLEAQRVELQTELTEQQLQRSEERLQLARLIGQPSGTIEWRVTPWEPYRGPFAPEAQWVALGLENRPEVLQQRFELAAFGADYRLTSFSPFDGAELGAASERDQGEWALGPAVTSPIPLFDFGQAKRRRVRAALIEARNELTRLRRQVVEETRRAYAAFQASRENLQRVRNELIPLAEQRLVQAEAQFKAGQTDITGLLLAEENVRAARTRLVELERRNTEALIRLQRAVGGAGATSHITKVPGASATEPAGSTSSVATAETHDLPSAPDSN